MRRITSTGSWLPLTALKDVIGRGALLSRRVKSFCSRPAKGGPPDLGVTTTSRLIVLPGGWGGDASCCAEVTTVGSQDRTRTAARRAWVSIDFLWPISLRAPRRVAAQGAEG